MCTRASVEKQTNRLGKYTNRDQHGTPQKQTPTPIFYQCKHLAIYGQPCGWQEKGNATRKIQPFLRVTSREKYTTCGPHRNCSAGGPILPRKNAGRGRCPHCKVFAFQAKTGKEALHAHILMATSCPNAQNQQKWLYPKVRRAMPDKLYACDLNGKNRVTLYTRGFLQNDDDGLRFCILWGNPM